MTDTIEISNLRKAFHVDGRELVVGGFRNVWSESGRLLPNREFEHRIPVAL